MSDIIDEQEIIVILEAWCYADVLRAFRTNDASLEQYNRAVMDLLQAASRLGNRRYHSHDAGDSGASSSSYDSGSSSSSSDGGDGGGC